MKKKNSSTYDVGHSKPPKDAQWQKGESGNPKGRPKKPRDTFENDIKAILNKKLLVTKGGKEVELTMRRLLLEKIFNMAINGDTAMVRIAVPMLKFSDDSPEFEIQPQDEAAFKAFLKRMGVNNDSKN